MSKIKLLALSGMLLSCLSFSAVAGADSMTGDTPKLKRGEVNVSEVDRKPAVEILEARQAAEESDVRTKLNTAITDSNDAGLSLANLRLVMEDSAYPLGDKVNHLLKVVERNLELAQEIKAVAGKENPTGNYVDSQVSGAINGLSGRIDDVAAKAGAAHAYLFDMQLDDFGLTMRNEDKGELLVTASDGAKYVVRFAVGTDMISTVETDRTVMAVIRSISGDLYKIAIGTQMKGSTKVAMRWHASTIKQGGLDSWLSFFNINRGVAGDAKVNFLKCGAGFCDPYSENKFGGPDPSAAGK